MMRENKLTFMIVMWLQLCLNPRVEEVWVHFFESRTIDRLRLPFLAALWAVILLQNYHLRSERRCGGPRFLGPKSS